MKESNVINLEKKERIYKYFKIPITEVVLYHIVYWGAGCYSLWNFYNASKLFRHRIHLTVKNDNVFGSYQDQSDWEWSVFLPMILESIPYNIMHLIFAQIIRKMCPMFICQFYLLFSIIMLFKFIGSIGTMICVVVVIFMYLSVLPRKKYIIWICWCITLIALNTRHVSDYMGIWLSDVTDGEYKISVIVAWIILRSLSFTLEVCNERSISKNRTLLLNGLAYCFYFPLLITGPYMSYSDFLTGLTKPFIGLKLKDIMILTGNLCKFFGWIALTEFLTYHFYAHSLFNEGHILWEMNSWALTGYVYYLLIFFLLKYVVFYGLLACFAKYEGFTPPRHPFCVLMVSKFSDVWRYFDCGLYQFIMNHIYIPFIGNERNFVKQLQGSIVVFTFIYVWHGVSNDIFWWTVFNFAGVATEKIYEKFIVDQIIKSEYFGWKYEIQKRLCFIVYSALVIASTLAMVIFLSSTGNAKIISIRLLTSFNMFPFVTIIVFYCISQCGFHVNQYRSKKIKL